MQASLEAINTANGVDGAEDSYAIEYSPSVNSSNTQW